MAKLAAHQSLGIDEARTVMEEMLSGEATPSQLGAFLTALRMKGESVEEMVGLAMVMRDHALPVPVKMPVVDLVGTGNDRLGTFNVSTTAAIIAASAGQAMAKHGNRAVTSKSGSADLLEALGVAIDLNPEDVAECIHRNNFGFLLATLFHPAMKAIAPVRRELGIGTVFNVLGPLTNPARAEAQVMGVADAKLAPKMAEALRRLGCKHAFVVHGLDGMDELSLCAPTEVHEVRDGWIRAYQVAPEDFGLERQPLEALAAATPEASAAVARQVVSGQRGAPRDVAVLNAAAALAAGDKVQSLQEGMKLAADALDSGKSQATLDALIAVSEERRLAAAG
ncbi:MAG: anthranilate phosphoribosyltransferase, partial [Chloroflexota bacterium]|nr:anthranilate phosphoribosyltransferase [Chloroflexota bacterium]